MIYFDLERLFLSILYMKPIDGDNCDRDHMVEEMDYVLVPEEVWTRLTDTFGLVEGQEPVSRTVRQDQTTEPTVPANS